MKPATLAAIVGGVFVVGIGLGLGLQDDDPPPAPVGGATPVAQAGPPVDPASTPAFAPPPPPMLDSGPAGGPPPAREALPPAPPPPVPPAALSEGDRIARELDQAGERGGGRVTTLVYNFDSEEERRAWEAKYRERWDRRLKKEVDIKLRRMREEAGISATQEEELGRILSDELRERQRLVDLLTESRLSQTTFRQGVQANVTRTQERLQRLLSAEQLAAYQGLDPREEVLDAEYGKQKD